jgi:hypothetical protein
MENIVKVLLEPARQVTPNTLPEPSPTFPVDFWLPNPVKRRSGERIKLDTVDTGWWLVDSEKDGNSRLLSPLSECRKECVGTPFAKS